MSTRSRDTASTEEVLRAALAEMDEFYDHAPSAYPSLDADGLFVRDDGADVDPDNAEHLFGAFQRLHTPAEL
jgi:hypothetical protein